MLGWMERRGGHRRRETLYLKACVCGLQSLSTSTLGCHVSAQPSPAQSIQAVSRETRTRHILMCDINCTPVIWASHSPAGFCLPQLFYYDSFVMIGLLCIVVVWLMAKETVLHCSRGKIATGVCVGEKASTIALSFIEDMNVGKKLFCFSEFLLRACSHRNSRLHVVIFLHQLPLCWKSECTLSVSSNIGTLPSF